MAIRVNMLRWRLTSERAPRAKNGQPAHSTTGVAKANWTRLDNPGSSQRCAPAICAPISSTTTGAASATPIQNRRVMSASSGLGPLSADAITGSSAMPQIGHAPGPAWRISGCIGQV